MGKFLIFVGSNWNCVPGYIKNIDSHHESFSSKKQVIKKLSPKNLWQTYMKWTVVGVFANLRFISAFLVDFCEAFFRTVCKIHWRNILYKSFRQRTFYVIHQKMRIFFEVNVASAVFQWFSDVRNNVYRWRKIPDTQLSVRTQSSKLLESAASEPGVVLSWKSEPG